MSRTLMMVRIRNLSELYKLVRIHSTKDKDAGLLKQVTIQ